LPAWGDAVARSETRESLEALTRAQLLAQSLAEATGDRLDLEAVQVLGDLSGRNPALLPRAAVGPGAYGRRQSAFDRGDVGPALALYAKAETELTAARSPFAKWAAYNVLLCRYYKGDVSGPHGASRAMLAAVAGRPYPILEAQLEWMLGLADVVRSNV